MSSSLLDWIYKGLGARAVARRSFSRLGWLAAFAAAGLMASAYAEDLGPTPPPTPSATSVPPIATAAPAEMVAEPPAIAEYNAAPIPVSTALTKHVRAALLVDMDTGQVLFEKSADKRMPPASLTKIMTALIALQVARADSVVTVSPEAVRARPTKLGLKTYEQFRLLDLVAAMLITSANDACVAVASYLAGSEDNFVVLMNNRAASLGLQNTHFENACGFDGPRHYSTASDLARLAEAAMKDPTFRMLVRLPEMDITSMDQSRRITLRNTNYLLNNEEVTGIKTGFTSKAGRCLIASAMRDGHQILLVGLNFRDRWFTSQELLRYGLSVSMFNES